jgi:hypothetical protein
LIHPNTIITSSTHHLTFEIQVAKQTKKSILLIGKNNIHFSKREKKPFWALVEDKKWDLWSLWKWQHFLSSIFGLFEVTNVEEVGVVIESFFVIFFSRRLPPSVADLYCYYYHCDMTPNHQQRANNIPTKYWRMCAHQPEYENSK